MIPLLTASTTTTPQGKRRPTSPSETGEVRWDYGIGLRGLFREVLEHHDPAITAEDRELPDWMFANTTGGLVDVSNLRLEAYLLDRLTATFVEAVDEVFADGMESVFSRKVLSIIRTHGDVVIRAIDRVIQSERANVEVAGEVLRQVGSIADPRTHHSRLTLLLRKLESPDPRIRDAASIGIAALDDPAAIGSIRRAVERERSPLLKRNLQLVLDQLQATQQ